MDKHRTTFQTFNLTRQEDDLVCVFAFCTVAVLAVYGKLFAEIDKRVARQFGQQLHQLLPACSGLRCLQFGRQRANQDAAILILGCGRVIRELVPGVVDEGLAIGRRAQRLGQIAIESPGVIDQPRQVVRRAALVAELKLDRVGSQQVPHQVLALTPVKPAWLDDLRLVARHGDDQRRIRPPLQPGACELAEHERL